MADSILTEKRKCYFCGDTYELHKHHIYGGANRQRSEKHGFTVWLCPRHHCLSNDSVHLNYKLNLRLKCDCQAVFEKTHTREEFMNIIGKSYL